MKVLEGPCARLSTLESLAVEVSHGITMATSRFQKLNEVQGVRFLKVSKLPAVEEGFSSKACDEGHFRMPRYFPCQGSDWRSVGSYFQRLLFAADVRLSELIQFILHAFLELNLCFCG